jgi:STE24 endopeptidase
VHTIASPRRLALLAVALACGIAGAAAAQEADGPPPEQETMPALAGGEETATEAPTPFDPETATRAYLARPSAEEKARSDAYFEGGYWLQLWGFSIGLAVAWLLLATRLSARMRDLAARATRRPPLQTWLYALQYVLVTAVLGFPLAVYSGFVREHRYGLATQGFVAWMGDQAKGLAVSLVLFPLLLMALYAVFRKAPRTWWLWGAAVALLFLVLVILVAPVYIDPLFNTYKPLEDERVRGPILSMARSSGIEVDDVYEFDASRQTTRISANVSGFLGTMRIRLNDNLLDRTSPPEIEAVMGHEIGHYVLNHVYESILFFGVVLVGGFGFLRWAFGRVLRTRGARWGVAGIGDPAGLPLLGALLSVYFFVLTPVLNTYIRVNEAEADIYGLQTARQPDGFAEVALKLGEYRKLDPGPLEEWIFFDHPSGRARIRMAMDWKAENLDR